MILFLAATASFIFHAHDSHAHSKNIYIYQLGIIIYGNVPVDIIKTYFYSPFSEQLAHTQSSSIWTFIFDASYLWILSILEN